VRPLSGLVVFPAERDKGTLSARGVATATRFRYKTEGMFRAVGSLAGGVALGVALAACGASAGSRSSGNKLIVLDHSIGGVALGEKRIDAERHLGRGFVRHAGDQKPPEPALHTEDVLYAKYGLEVGYVSGNATQASRERGRVFVLLTHSPRYRTPQGVHVGSSAGDLYAIKGVKCGNLLGLDGQHGGHVHNQPGTLFRLSGPSGVVARISIAYSD
jgi:hypothetical protein